MAAQKNIRALLALALAVCTACAQAGSSALTPSLASPKDKVKSAGNMSVELTLGVTVLRTRVDVAELKIKGGTQPYTVTEKPPTRHGKKKGEEEPLASLLKITPVQGRSGEFEISGLKPGITRVVVQDAGSAAQELPIRVVELRK